MDPRILALGLSEAEAARRLAADGYNELPADKPRSLAAIAAKVMREPMLLMLLSAGAIYFLLGDTKQAVILLLSVFGVMGISFYQERKTERALAALRDLSSPRALVVRDGVARRIAGREVVEGDIVLVSEGDRIPAGVLLSGANVSTDESLLTGESAPVHKTPSERVPEHMQRPGEENTPFVYSGTLVVQGQGALRMLATGTQTEIGRIGSALKSIERESTRLQLETRRIVKLLAIIALALCVALAVSFAVTRGDWLNGFLAGLTLAMAILPEEFPVVLAVFLALGAWRIARNQVLTRRVAAIEMLGAATVLCVDKTGTLTQNRMSVAALYAKGNWADLSIQNGKTLSLELREVLRVSVLASSRDPFDPMEKAILEAGLKLVSHERFELARVYPLTRELLAVTHAWKDRGDYFIAAKGAPEAITELCRLDDAQRASMTAEVSRMAERGLRVLGVAKARFTGGILPETASAFAFEWLGLMGLADPIREHVSQAVRECRSAGMRVIMITGDSPATARNIARKAGLDADVVITGRELDAMDDDLLRQRIARVDVFCRVVPEQKLRIVNALKANGEIVAMTGDGVNDAPALKAAHIGIAMGRRGTDVAREAADVVLLDDDFSSIVKAVRLGRRIFDNLRKAFAFVVGVHVPTVGMSFLPVLFGWPLMLFPVHIVLLELIIDPACTIAFEAEREETAVMNRAPRDPRENLLDTSTLAQSLLHGAIVLALVFAVYAFMTTSEHEEAAVRAASFTTLIIGNLGLILVSLSRSRPLRKTLSAYNPALWSVVFGALAMLGLALSVPPVRELFQFSQLDIVELIAAAGTGAGALLLLALLRLPNRAGTMA